MNPNGRFGKENLKANSAIFKIIHELGNEEAGLFDLIRRDLVAHAFLIMALVVALPQIASAETTNLNTYNAGAVVNYEEINDFEVKSFPLRMAHPYEIIIPNTTLGQVIVCRIYDTQDDAGVNPPEMPEGVTISSHRTGRDEQFVVSGNNATHVFFSNKISDATFRCFNVNVDR